MERFRKVFNIVMVVLFILFAALQYNDPDPYIWIPVYLFAAWLCYQAGRRNYNGWIYAIFSGILLVYAGYLFFTDEGVLNWATRHDSESLVQTMKASKPWIEQTREFGGLLIVLFVLGLNWFSRKLSPLLPK